MVRSALLDRPYKLWSSIDCVCCACDSSVRLDAPSLCYIYVVFCIL